jgi:hypothetical protein
MRNHRQDGEVDAFRHLEYPPSASSTLPLAERHGGEALILNVRVPARRATRSVTRSGNSRSRRRSARRQETIADYAGPELLPPPSQALRDRIAAEMTSLLTQTDGSDSVARSRYADEVRWNTSAGGVVTS